MSNELTPTVKIGSLIKKVGIQGARDESRKRMAEVKPEECINRYAIGYDDSGSMMGSMQDAAKAVAGFLGACSPLETSVAVYPYNMESKGLTNIFDMVNAFVQGIKATGSTPLWLILARMLDAPITRAIIFSDGSPTDSESDEITKACDKHIPVDTVYIGSGDSDILKDIAERTGGIYLRFDDTVTFSKQLKYLSPKYVALLSNADLKAKIQRGENI
jgi:hypothetical protein